MRCQLSYYWSEKTNKFETMNEVGVIFQVKHRGTLTYVLNSTKFLDSDKFELATHS